MKLILIDILLNLLGIVIYFAIRYSNRKDKSVKPSLKFWLGDNLPEMISTIAMNIACMIIIHLPGASIDFTKVFSVLPFGLSISGQAALSFMFGLGLTWAFYNLFKAKVKAKLNL